MEQCDTKQNQPVTERFYQVDNIRLILLFLTILGHFLKMLTSDTAILAYRIIYSFHMPAFLFLSGCFAKFSQRKVLKGLILPYLLFQVLYLDFQSVIEGEFYDLKFTTPYWILWYLLAMIIYYCCLPMLDVSNRKVMLIILFIAVWNSLNAGFNTDLGFIMSFSRIVVFFPFFIGGFYCKKIGLNSVLSFLKKYRLLFLAVSGIAIAFIEYIFINWDTPASAFYGAYYYSFKGADLKERALFLLCALCWIVFLFLIVPGKNIPVITRMGSNTMSGYLLHGFVRMIFEENELLHYSDQVNLLLSVGITVVLIAVLQCPIMIKLFRKLFA